MAQHLWLEASRVRVCEVCHAMQSGIRGVWAPAVSPICPGDDENNGRRRPRPKPNAPSDAPRVLEVVL